MFLRQDCQSNSDLIDSLSGRTGSRLSPRVTEVMKSVDRAKYLKCDLNGMPYADQPLPISSAATISAPHMHAMALELLEDKLIDGSKAMDVGSGSGYLTVCMAKMCNVLTNGQALVVGIELDKDLVKFARSNIARDCEALVHCKNFILRDGDGWAGSPENAPFDCIHVGAAAPQLPLDLMKQLNIDGKLMVPFGPSHFYQSLLIITRLSKCNEVVREEDVQRACASCSLQSPEIIRCTGNVDVSSTDLLMKMASMEDNLDSSSRRRRHGILFVIDHVGIYSCQAITSVAFVPLVKSGVRPKDGREDSTAKPVLGQSRSHSSANSAFYSIGEDCS